jgi:peptide/nickel transport system substrate-binding protein
MTARLRKLAAAVTVAVACAAGLSSCSGKPASEITYVVDGTLTTYNTNTVAGAASSGPQAFARVLTGFNYHGPEGQIVGDHDFGTIAVVGRAPLVLDYVISDKAVYSDGKPITCDDLVLAWAAQSGRFPGFDAASQGGYREIVGVDCAPGQKRARVSFAPDRALVDFGQLFAATSLMPAHVIADELGVDVTTAIINNDAPTIGRIAQAWDTSWDLTPRLDAKRFPSSGSYKLDSVGDDGAVVLVANDKWWGAKPVTNKITVRPRGADVQDHLNDGSVDVVDVATGSSGVLNMPEDYTQADSPSAGIEQLVFAGQGPMAAPPARRALALCTPRDVIARNVKVPIANTRLNPVTEEAVGSGEAVGADQFSAANPAAARDALGNQPLAVRIGYQTPNARLAATVGAIAKSCATAGIDVKDSGSATTGPLSLRNNEIDILLASTGGATGGGSTGSSALDAYDLHTGNGNNLSGYSNPRIDTAIDALAVTADPKEVARLLGDAGPVLWADVPTLPLYRQQRTLITSKKMYAVSSNPTRWGAGWNMDRWMLAK